MMKPGTAWSQGLGLWCRLMQTQIDASLRFWAVWASTLPKPCARELAEVAERQAEPIPKANRAQRRPAAAPRRAQRPEVVH